MLYPEGTTCLDIKKNIPEKTPAWTIFKIRIISEILHILGDFNQKQKAMGKDLFKNKNGDLTRYAFACGYVQEQKIEPFTKQLFMEHRAFHIQVTEEGKVGYAVWKTFDNDELTKARRFFRGIYCVTDSKGNHSLLIR